MRRASRKHMVPGIGGAVLIGLFFAWVGAGWAGRVDVIWEVDKCDLLADSLMTFGMCVASAGDVNSDGYDDILVGNYAADMGPDATFTGRVYLYLGGPDMDTIPDLTFVGETKWDLFGSVAGPGDLNSDGYDDVLVGACGAVTDTSASGLLVRRGKVYVYFGGAPMDSIPDLVMKGELNGSAYGRSVSAAGDINGDGEDDFVVGADQMLVYHRDCVGRVYVYYGGPDVDIRPDMVLTGPGPPTHPSNFGSCVAGVGDLNADGYSDLMVGACCHTEQYLWQGKVYIYLGGSSMDTVPDVEMLGEGPGNFLGRFGVSGAGDVNGDAYDDAMTGTPLYPWGFCPPNLGKLYILFGGDPMDGVPDWTKEGANDDVRLGNSFSGLGDVDLDTYDDIIAGAKDEHTVQGPDGYRDHGRAYLFLGGSRMPVDEDCSLGGSYDDCSMGGCTVNAGDVDGDSLNEFIITSGCHTWVWGCHVRLCKWVETALVTDLAARGGDGLVKLDWLAQYENDTRGYNVYRSESCDTTGWVRVNEKLVTGAESYSHADTGVANGETYYYWVEVLGRRGNTDHFGPVSATPESLVLSSFSAWKGAASYVVVHWETGSEPELTGWNIYRREERDSLPGENEKVNGEPIPQGGPAYEWSDCWGVQEGKVYFYWLSAVDLLGGERYFGPVEVNTSRIRLFQNTPNPFESWTTIRCSITYPCRVTLKVYDVSGRLIKTLVCNQPVSEMPGQLTVTWDGTDDAGRAVSAGVYFYRLSAGESSATRKLVVLR